MSRSLPSLTGMEHIAHETATTALTRYADHLTGSDLDGLADDYAYPALAVSPDGLLVITDPDMVRQFFAAGGEAYRARGIDAVVPGEVHTEIEGRNLWVGHVVWHNLDDAGQVVGTEHNAYQLITGPDGHRRIAVTTPLDQPDPDSTTAG